VAPPLLFLFLVGFAVNGGKSVRVAVGVEVSVCVGVAVGVEVEVGELVWVNTGVMVMLGAEVAGRVSEIVGVDVPAVMRLTIS